MLALGDFETSIAQPVFSKQIAGVDRRSIFTAAGHAQSGILVRVEFGDNGLKIVVGLSCVDATFCGRDSKNFEAWVVQGHADGDCIINTHIAIDNDFAAHREGFVSDGGRTR